jgi:hypothetical protein
MENSLTKLTGQLSNFFNYLILMFASLTNKYYSYFQVAGKANVPTQVILQSQKALPTVTMQQLQLFKQVRFFVKNIT